MARCRCTRRDFLKSAAAGAAAFAFAPVVGVRGAYGAANAPNNGRFLVVLNLLGGNDGLNTVVPTHLQPYYDRRPTIRITSGLHSLSGGYALHPNLVALKSLWDEGHLHVVNKVGYPNKNLSHFTSQDIFSYGVREYSVNGDGRGWLGRFADEYCANPVQPLGVIAVGVGRRPDFESDVADPLILTNVAGFNVRADTELGMGPDHNLRVRTVRETLAADTPPLQEPGLTIFGTLAQTYDLVDRVQQETAGWTSLAGAYPTTTIGRHLETISRLLHARASFQTKVFYTGIGGFDTHADQAAQHGALMAQLDNALSVFIADMKAKGAWNDCAVIVISEFGRRNFENGSQGTDHGHGNAFLVFGGRVHGGVTGDLVESDLTMDEPNFAYDFRELYADLVETHLGVPSAPLFPEPFTRTGDVDLVA